jgi:hypothetical protein
MPSSQLCVEQQVHNTKDLNYAKSRQSTIHSYMLYSTAEQMPALVLYQCDATYIQCLIFITVTLHTFNA